MNKFTDDFFINQIKTTKLLQDVTKKEYLYRLNEIQTSFFDRKPKILWVITHPDIFKQALIPYGERREGKLDNVNLSVTTLAHFCVPFISLLIANREIQESYPTILNQWKNLKASILLPEENRILEGKPSEKQKKALFTFEQLESIRDGLPNGMEKLILSMYTMIAPPRSNLGLVKILDQETDLKLDNYIDINQKKFVINKHKTVNSMGSLIIDLPKQLVDQIKNSLSQNPRKYLFTQENGLPYSPNSWNPIANRLMKRVLNNNYFSINMFRHIYLSQKDLNLKDMTLKEKKEIADKMGHSVNMQSRYIWKNEGKSTS